jgi:hypothetical protein
MLARIPRELVLTWEQRVVSGLPLGPTSAILVIAGVLFGLYLAAAYAFGLRVLDPEFPGPLPIDGGAWTALIFSLLGGYGFVVMHVGMARNADDVAALHAVTPGATAAELRRWWIERMEAGARRSGLAFALGLLAGLALTLVTSYLLLPEMPLAQRLRGFLWFLIFSPLVFGQIGRAAFLTLHGLRQVARRVESDFEIDLLDLSGLDPLGRIGLRNAFGWIVGSTILLLLMLNIPLGSLLTAYPGIVGILALAVAAFVIPIRPAHRAIRRAKREELGRLNAEIHRDRDAVRSAGPGSAEAAMRLSGLLAYRSAIESVREWPLDTPMRARFLLYLAIPIGGWLGGALVERGLGLFLD